MLPSQTPSTHLHLHNPAQIHSVTSKLMKRARWRKEKSMLSILGLVSALKGYPYLGVAILMTTFKFPEEHMPPKKGKSICSCQWSVSLSSRYGLAATTAFTFTPSQIKQHWEHQDRANLRLIQVEREPGRFPASTSAQSMSKNRMESAGVGAPQPAGNPRLC